MKVYVLTEIDLQHVGYSPNTIQIFPTHGAAVAEMARMYGEALKKFNTTDDNPANCFDASGYAYVADADYRLDVYECVLDTGFEPITTLQEITVVAEDRGVRSKLMLERNMSRDEVWALMQKWAEEYEARYEDYDYCANNTSLYDEVDAFVQEKYEDLDKPELRPDADVVDDIELYDEDFFGKDAEVTVRLHIYDGYAEGDGVRVEYPKLADLTAAQIEELDDYLGGRIKDSGFVCPDDVLLKYGKVVSFHGIMDTLNGHDPDLVRRINVAWIEKKEMFRPILCALYERDIDEITDHDAFRIPAWEEWKEYNDGIRSGDWTTYNEKALVEMQTNWEDYADNYLAHIADGQDLECILDFVRG